MSEQAKPATKMLEAATETGQLTKGGRLRRSNRGVGSGFRRDMNEDARQTSCSGHRFHMTAAQRGPPTTGILNASTLASHSGRASADGSPGVADGGSCHAHTVNSCPTSAAGSSHFRDHAVRLRNNRRWCHSLRGHCNR
jgi:hypothetical protein